MNDLIKKALPSGIKVAIIVATAICYYLLIMKPTQHIIYQKITSEFKNEMKLKSFLLDNNISRNIEGAKSISSRSMIRIKMQDYSENKISFNDLKEYTQPKYIEGIKALDNCIYAARYIDQNQLCRYDQDIDLTQIDTQFQTNNTQLSSEVILSDSFLVVKVSSPIYTNNTFLGYDILISRCQQIIKSIALIDQQLSIVKTTNLLLNNDTIFIKNDSIYYQYPSMYAPVIYTFKKDTDQVFKELAFFKKRQLIIVLLLLISITLVLFIINKRSKYLLIKKSKLLQNLINEKTEHLNNAIEEHENANQKLIDSEKELKASNQTKDKFFSIIAHDLINPINSMMGLSEYLLLNYEKYSEQKRIDLITSIHEGIISSYKLLENLLEWSRIHRGTIDFNPTRLSVYDGVKEIIELTKVQATQKQLTVINRVDSMVEVFADQNMLNTTIRNLVSNAIKYSKKGGLIEVGTLLKSKNSECITIFVKDSGVGMNEKNLEHLFSLTETISTPGTNKETGTGLGLVLCKEFIEKHNGKIWVESIENVGSTFYFTLPAN